MRDCRLGLVLPGLPDVCCAVLLAWRSLPLQALLVSPPYSWAGTGGTSRECAESTREPRVLNGESATACVGVLPGVWVRLPQGCLWWGDWVP